MLKSLLKLKWLTVSYVLLVHVVVILAIVSPYTVERIWQLYYNTPTVLNTYKGQVAAHVIQDRNLPKGCVVFIGDSISAEMELNGVDTAVINFSIISDNTEGLLWRIPQYKHLESAGTIVLEIGVNDLSRYPDEKVITNYKKILELLPHSIPVIVSGILPVNEGLLKRNFISYLTGQKPTNARIKSMNNKLSELCQTYKKAYFIGVPSDWTDETGNMRGEYTYDGLHLTRQGYGVWTACLEKQIVIVQQKK